MCDDDGCDRFPSLEQVETDDGPQWRGCSGGECWQHHQRWQVMVWLQARSAGLDQQSPAGGGAVDLPAS